MILYFTAEKSLEVHNWIIKVSGGLQGVYHDTVGRMASIIEHMQNDDYYPDFEDKLTHLFYSIVMNHVFVDGNKRSALSLCAYMLEINSYDFCISDLMLLMEDVVVVVAAGKISKELLRSIIIEIIANGELSEAIKVELLDAKTSMS